MLLSSHSREASTLTPHFSSNLLPSVFWCMIATSFFLLYFLQKFCAEVVKKYNAPYLPIWALSASPQPENAFQWQEVSICEGLPRVLTVRASLLCLIKLPSYPFSIYRSKCLFSLWLLASVPWGVNCKTGPHWPWLPGMEPQHPVPGAC